MLNSFVRKLVIKVLKCYVIKRKYIEAETTNNSPMIIMMMIIMTNKHFYFNYTDLLKSMYFVSRFGWKAKAYFHKSADFSFVCFFFPVAKITPKLGLQTNRIENEHKAKKSIFSSLVVINNREKAPNMELKKIF